VQQPSFLSFYKFRQLLESMGCSCAVMSTYGEMTDTDGTPTPALFLFERTDAGVARHAIVHIYEPSLPMAVGTIHSVCAALGIELSLSGL
jgi:hypothetical protein